MLEQLLTLHEEEQVLRQLVEVSALRTKVTAAAAVVLVIHKVVGLLVEVWQQLGVELVEGGLQRLEVLVVAVLLRVAWSGDEVVHLS